MVGFDLIKKVPLKEGKMFTCTGQIVGFILKSTWTIFVSVRLHWVYNMSN